MNKLKLDCEEFDAPEVLGWFCKTEGTVREFRRKIRGSHLLGYVCSSCYSYVHPISLVIAGKILENKWNYRDKIWPTVLKGDNG